MGQKFLLFLEKIEEYLLKSNIHVDIVEEIMKYLSRQIENNNSLTKNEIIALLSNYLQSIMQTYVTTFDIGQKIKPYVMLVCGINGSGKTTTVGKMAYLLKKYNWNIIVAECDVYRTGTKEQLHSLIKGDISEYVFPDKDHNTPAKIAVKAYNDAVKNNKDILIIDTSGRMHGNQNLMSELVSIKQKLKKISSKIPHDTVLIIDSNCGYDALEQASLYKSIVGINGIIATKLDVSKQPGIILSVCKKLNIKIFGICDGEEEDKINDLEPKSFVNSILSNINSII